MTSGLQDTWDEPNSLAVVHRLPCGCTLQQRVASAIDSDWFDGAAGVLKFWVQDRAANHDCALVSKENPTGNRKKKPPTTQPGA